MVYTLDPADWVSAGAVGEPGRRTFYLQARQGTDYLAVVVEKEQVVALARVAQDLLRRAGRPITRDELRGGDLNLEPVQPEWRAGSLRAGADPDGERFLIEIERLGGEGQPESVMRWTMGRAELVALAADATFAVEPNTWRRCRRCRRPLDLDRVHAC